MKKMIQIIDKMQAKQPPKAQKMRTKDASEFKDSLNQAVSEQAKPESTNQTSSQTNQTQNTDKPETETGSTNENSISKDELGSAEKNLIDGLSLAVNAFQMEVKPEIKSVQIELPKEPEMLKVDTNMVAQKLDTQNVETAKLSGEISETQSLEISNSLNKNMITEKPLEKNVDTSGKFKLENFEQKAEEVSSETTKKPELKTESSEVKLDSKANTEDLQKVTSKTTDNQEKPALETASKETASVLEPQKQIKPENTDVITVKVGDGQTISSEKLVTEVAKNITIKTDGKNEYELQLDPENLGKIKVKLLFEDGKLSVSLLCNNSKTANLLSEGISNLGQAIQQNTKSEVTVNVSEESYLNDNNQQDKHNSQNQQQQRDRKQDETEFADTMKLGLWEIENLKKQFSSDFRIM